MKSSIKKPRNQAGQLQGHWGDIVPPARDILHAMDALQFATRLARQAGTLLLEDFYRRDLQSGLKEDHSIVTDADLASDRLITNAIQAECPGEALLSEELQPAYSPPSPQNDAAVWIVDPLDGTSNFSLGFPLWGVLIARLVGGWPDTAVLYYPAVNELYSAQRGQGATMNGLPISVLPPDSSRPHAFFTCCSRTFRQYNIKIPYKVRILGSASYSLCAVARGMALLSFEATPKVWDIAAGWLLVQEAGGLVETLDGSQPFPLRPGLPYAHLSFPTVSAATPELLARAHAQIIPK